jgi:hypothetical protein
MKRGERGKAAGAFETESVVTEPVVPVLAQLCRQLTLKPDLSFDDPSERISQSFVFLTKPPGTNHLPLAGSFVLSTHLSS